MPCSVLFGRLEPASFCHRLQSVVGCSTTPFLLLGSGAGFSRLSVVSVVSGHVYHEIYLHLNWHAKNDAPLLTGTVEEGVHAQMRAKCRAVKGVYLHGLGGTDTHVHVAVSVEPSVTVSDLVQELKGFSAHEVNRRLGYKAVQWQRGYGVVSFGRAHLDWVLDYIGRQREHHAAGRVEARLEMCSNDAFEKPG